jgi:hypothetical protein
LNGKRTFRLARLTAAAALLGALIGAPGARAAAAAKPVPPDASLSNETTSTQWAYVAHIAAIHVSPAKQSRTITTTHWYTEDNFREIYLLLRAHWDSRGHEWIKIRIPGRPNGRVGWVRRFALGSFHMTHDEVVVNREKLRMYFYSNGQQIWSAPVGVGKPSTPTPAGHFWIRERFKITDPRSGYYPFAFGTSDYSTLTEWARGGVVGIHGPYFAASQIPGHISHGCIRLRVSDDAWLGHHLKYGTPLLVV